MVDYTGQLKELEDELRGTQYNKATEHHFAIVKAKMARLREKQELSRGTGKGSAGFSVQKSGDATVVILGFPSVGKSTLLNALTGTQSKVAAYAFTTLDCIPGVLQYKHAKIQILDVPGIIRGAASGKGRGKEVLAVVRSADLILILIDSFSPEQYGALQKELFAANVRANAKQPDVKIVRRSRGGIDIASTVKLTKVSNDGLIAILREFKLQNCHVVIRDDIDLDEFIDAVENNRSYIPAISVVSKIDLLSKEQVKALVASIKPDVLVSASTGEGIPQLKEALFKKLGFLRVFLKEINKKPDMEEPMIVRKGATLRTICDKIHRDFTRKFKYVRVWGASAKFPGQQFKNLEKKLDDGDIVEIHTS